MFFADIFLTRGRLPISSFLCFVGGFSMGSWLTLFHQLQMEKDLDHQDEIAVRHSHEPYLLLMTLVLSAPGNFDLRDTLRNSWLRLNPSKNSVRHMFAIGTDGLESEMMRKLNQEQTVENDLLLLHFQDSFFNLTLKMTHALTSLSNSMPSYFTLKVDDDSFARLDSIVEELEARQEKVNSRSHSPAQSKCFYWGFFDGRARVKRAGKWKETEYNLCDLYLPYALGGGYILSKSCVDFVVKNRDVLHGYHNEDVSMGSWLSSIFPEKRHDVRFDTEYESRGCNNNYLVQHKLTQAEMIERYTNIINHKKLCTKEFQRRPSYQYDWSVPPSQCCKRNSSII